MAEDASSAFLPPPPPHSDAPWVNSPILFTSGPLRGRWIRAELTVQQQPRRGRKGAIHDLRPLHPPPTVRLKLWQIIHPVPRASVIPNSSPETLWFETQPIPPPPNAQSFPITIEPKLTTHFLCFASLFKVHPPTREQEYGRVDRKVIVGLPEGSSSPDGQYSPSAINPGEVIERPKSDKSRQWRSLRPHPMTAISCNDPQWSTALAQARARADEGGEPDSPQTSESDTNKDIVKDVESIEGDLGFGEMLRLESYLPREAPKWVYPYQDVTAHLSKRETAGHLIPSNENSEPAFYFVFSDLAIRNEGYFSLRFHIVNLDWRVDPQFSRPGTGFFSPLCDCVTDPFAVYSTKEFPGLPPTTEFTSYLVRNGVRIRFRDDRGVDAAAGEVRGRAEGRLKVVKKNNPKNTGQIGVDVAIADAGGVAGGMSAFSFGANQDVDSQKEAILEMWKNSPGRATFQRTFDADDTAVNVPTMPSGSSPLRHRAGRSSTMGIVRGVTSPQNSPQLRDRRSFSHPSLDPNLQQSPTFESPIGYHPSPYGPPSTSAPGHMPPTTIHRSIPPASYRLLTQDLNLHPGEQRWSSVSPQSPPNSIPSPSYSSHPRWPEEEMEIRYGSMSGPNSSASASQHSPLMMRERTNTAHRYYPYPQASTSTHGLTISHIPYDERQNPAFPGPSSQPPSANDDLYHCQPPSHPQQPFNRGQ